MLLLGISGLKSLPTYLDGLRLLLRVDGTIMSTLLLTTRDGDLKKMRYSLRLYSLQLILNCDIFNMYIL